MSEYEFAPHLELNEDEHDLYIDLMSKAQDEAMVKVEALRESQRLAVEDEEYERAEAYSRAVRRLGEIQR